MDTDARLAGFSPTEGQDAQYRRPLCCKQNVHVFAATIGPEVLGDAVAMRLDVIATSNEGDLRASNVEEDARFARAETIGARWRVP
jgi:hypothetical protein